MASDVEEFVLDTLPFEDLVFEDVAVVLEEVDVTDVAVTHAEVHWLVTLCVLYIFNHGHWLRLPPIPESN